MRRPLTRRASDSSDGYTLVEQLLEPALAGVDAFTTLTGDMAVRLEAAYRNAEQYAHHPAFACNERTTRQATASLDAVRRCLDAAAAAVASGRESVSPMVWDLRRHLADARRQTGRGTAAA